MTNEDAQQLMRNAWVARRASFELCAKERESTLLQAKKDLARAAEIWHRLGQSVNHAQAIHLLANVEVDLGEQTRAQALWEEAIAILRTTDERLQLAHQIRHLGDLHRRCNRLKDAEFCYNEAMALYREHDPHGSLDFANAMRAMALLKTQIGETSLAVELWRETRDLYASVSLQQGVQEAQQQIAKLNQIAR